VRLEYLLFRVIEFLLGYCFPSFNFYQFFVDGLRKGATKIRSSAWLEHYTDNVGVTSSNLVGSTKKLSGGLAQLARASALHAEGHRFDSDILHREGKVKRDLFLR
jgi:hypothetical protein